MTPKRFFYILCGIQAGAIILLAGGYYLASNWLSSGIDTLSLKLSDQQVAEQRLSELQDLEKQRKQLEPIMPAIQGALPNEKASSTIALQLRNIAASSGMSLNNLTFAAAPAPGPTSQTVPAGAALAIPITFQLSGTYQQLQDFLQKQEHLSRYTSVTSLAISRGTNSKLSFDITLNAFVKP